MTHCIVALNSAGRFEKKNGIDWELVCTDNKTEKDNGLYDTKNRDFLFS